MNVQVSNAVLEILERLERKIHMVDHTMEELKALLDAQGAKLTKVKTDVETLLAKAASMPAAGLTADQQTLLNEMVETAQGANATLDATDAEVNPPAAAPAAPAEPAAPATTDPAAVTTDPAANPNT
jgi:peptidoglycan hydrolase CwlO-like protein